MYSLARYYSFYITITPIALFFGAIGFLFVGLTISDGNWSDYLITAAMPAGMVFLAAFLLSTRDSRRSSATFRTVCAQLLAAEDTSNQQFLSLKIVPNPLLLLETRYAISHFFDVPVSKVGRNLHLVNDLRLNVWEPAFQFCVVSFIMDSLDFIVEPHSIDRKPPIFAMNEIDSIDDLALAIEKTLGGFGPVEDE